MTSGGIALDTVSTRLQAGFSFGQSLWGVSGKNTNGTALSRRFASVKHISTASARVKMLARSNLYAGYFVVIKGRFPYLFMNLGTYAKAEEFIISNKVGVNRGDKTIIENFACISASTLVGSTAITAIECPKILDQLGGRGSATRYTVLGVLRTKGFKRLMQGYVKMNIRCVCLHIVTMPLCLLVT